MRCCSHNTSRLANKTRRRRVSYDGVAAKQDVFAYDIHVCNYLQINVCLYGNVCVTSVVSVSEKNRSHTYLHFDAIVECSEIQVFFVCVIFHFSVQ